MIKARAYSTLLSAVLVCSGASAQQQSNGERPTPSAATGEKSGSTTATGGAHLSGDKASRVADLLRSTAPPSIQTVTVEVGSPLPGELELLALPSAVISLVPEYSGYEYAITKSEIAFVDPKTRRIVEVIRQYGEPRPQSGSKPPAT